MHAFRGEGVTTMSTKLSRILYGEANPQVLAAQQKMLLETPGYVVVTALGRQAIADAVATSTFDLVILGHTLSKDDRHHLPYMTKKANPSTRVLVLHASCKHPKVDIALDSRDGARVVLKAVAELLAASPATEATVRVAVAAA